MALNFGTKATTDLGGSCKHSWVVGSLEHWPSYIAMMENLPVASTMPRLRINGQQREITAPLALHGRIRRANWAHFGEAASLSTVTGQGWQASNVILQEDKNLCFLGMDINYPYLSRQDWTALGSQFLVAADLTPLKRISLQYFWRKNSNHRNKHTWPLTFISEPGNVALSALLQEPL